MRPASPRGVLVARRLLAALVLMLLALVLMLFTTAPMARAGAVADAPQSAAVVEVDGSAQSADERVRVTVYELRTCGACRELTRWLGDREDVELITYDVSNPDNRARLLAEADRLQLDLTGVPVTVIGDSAWVGFGRETAGAIGSAIDTTAREQAHTRSVDPCADAIGDECATRDGATSEDATIWVPLVGEVHLGATSLVASSALIGFVDGFNPCSLWVLTVLLTIVVRTDSRRRVLAVGITFLVITALMYALFMLGLYSAMALVGHLGWIQAVAALFALVLGAVSIKEYFAPGGISLSIRESARPGVFQRMRAIVAHRRLLPALGATAGLAVVVSLLETPCTAGFPVLWTGLLHSHGVGPAEVAFYLLVYMIPFLLDELVVFLVAVLTMRATRMQEKHGRVLKLFTGIVMIVLAVTMVAAPQVMQNPVQALALFAGAFVAAALVHRAANSRSRQGRGSRT